MKTGFWASLIIFIGTLAFLIAVNSVDFGISIVFPEGISEPTPNIVQMREMVNALQEYNKLDGIACIFSFISTGVTGFIARIKGISLTH